MVFHGCLQLSLSPILFWDILDVLGFSVYKSLRSFAVGLGHIKSQRRLIFRGVMDHVKIREKLGVPQFPFVDTARICGNLQNRKCHVSQKNQNDRHPKKRGEVPVTFFWSTFVEENPKKSQQGMFFSGNLPSLNCQPESVSLEEKKTHQQKHWKKRRDGSRVR